MAEHTDCFPSSRPGQDEPRVLDAMATPVITARGGDFVMSWWLNSGLRYTFNLSPSEPKNPILGR